MSANHPPPDHDQRCVCPRCWAAYVAWVMAQVWAPEPQPRPGSSEIDRHLV